MRNDLTLSVKRSIGWLEEKINAMRSFEGSILSYVRFPKGKSDILRLDANENYFVDPEFLKAVFLEALKEVDLRLYNPHAIIELRKALAKYLDVPFECVGVGSGSEHLIDVIIQSFLTSGDEAVSIVPSFFIYGKRVRLRGAKLIDVSLKEDLSIDVDRILDNCSDRTRLVFVCSPNNPTGNQFGWNEIEALADGCSAVIVVDEAYAEFGGDSVCSRAVKKENIVVLRTFSKAFGLAGLRFGYYAACKELASALFGVIPYTVSTLISRFVVELLDKFGVVQDWVNEVKRERERLISKLRAIDGIEVFDSKTNFVTFKPMGDADHIYRGLLNRGVSVKNLGDLPVIGHCLRVTVGLPYMNDLFLKALVEVM
jgi:histidinol-phosphate aminotransferase